MDEGELQNEDDWPAVRPSGAFLSTVLDLAKWEGALSRDQILNEPTKREIWTPVRLNDGRTFPYGFGWQLDEWPADSKIPTGIPMIRHGGAMNGFRAGYVRWPSHRLTVIVLTNLSNAPYEGLVANIGIQVRRNYACSKKARRDGLEAQLAAASNRSGHRLAERFPRASHPLGQ